MYFLPLILRSSYNSSIAVLENTQSNFQYLENYSIQNFLIFMSSSYQSRNLEIEPHKVSSPFPLKEPVYVLPNSFNLEVIRT